MGVHFPSECLKYSLKNLHLGTARGKAMQIDLVVLVTTIFYLLGILEANHFKGEGLLKSNVQRKFLFYGLHDIVL